MNLRRVTIKLELGQDILVGPKNERAKITKMEYHQNSGDIMINTTKGPIKVLNFRLCEQNQEFDENPADKYR